jgi:mono/diheme cytochrome c family protein
LRDGAVSCETFEAAGYSNPKLHLEDKRIINRSEVCMRVLSAIGALAIVAGIGCAVVFFGGFYNVAGTTEDPAIVTWALTRVRTASIDRHAKDAPPASLDAAATVQAGAKAYATVGCVNCHGAPGAKWQKFSEGLHPDPPDLKDVAGEISPAQLFWVIKHGINMTGMPSFAAIKTDDQTIWRVVAFVRKMSIVSADDYKAWTAAP